MNATMMESWLPWLLIIPSFFQSANPLSLGVDFTTKRRAASRDDPNQVVQSTRRRQQIQVLLGAPSAAAALSVLLLPTNEAAHASSPPKSDLPIDPELSAAAQRLFDLDTNRLIANRDYQINVQGGKKPSKAEEDAAPGPLFKFVDPSVFNNNNRPTYKAFVRLLNNYNANVCAAEEVTPEETREAYDFLNAAMATPVMQFCYQYCKSKLPPEKFVETREGFVKLLYKIWFKMYKRCNNENEEERVAGSSGFEHVFVGEIKDGKVAGFHNWIQFYLQERLGNVDYRGAVCNNKDCVVLPNDQTRVLTYQLRWNGYDKYVGTSWIGVSPEFELAFYTLMFLVGKQDNIILLGTDNNAGERIKLDVKCYKIAKGKVATCFVESI